MVAAPATIGGGLNINKRSLIGRETTHQPIHFTVLKAHGGHVVEFRHYDEKTDRTTGGLYIINDQDDFSSELGKLVMMECLSR
jgi:hypothetical protein